MSKETQHPDVSTLSASKNGLVYLTPNDWTLIVDKAVRKKFKDGETIVQVGRRTSGLYVLVAGKAYVQISSDTVRNIGTGEVCGEISFLDDLPATASVIAQGTVEALFIDRPTLQSLFELFPHLGSRFYRSLAGSLSKRLRELIAPTVPTKKL
jgi:CRP-like cAMP-binding protein